MVPEMNLEPLGSIGQFVSAIGTLAKLIYLSSMRCTLAAMLVLLSACTDPVGERYSSVDAIPRSDTWEDWVVVGRFGSTGPFTLVDVKYCGVGDPCSFSHDGQGHTYERFQHYKLAVLQLRNEQNQFSHVVLRSEEEYGW